MKIGFASLILLAATTFGFAQPIKADQTSSQPDAKTFIALAMADGPTEDQRLVFSVRGATSEAVIADAVKKCYERAATGYMHTCQVWYGSAWIVGATCQQTPTTVKFGIGDDAGSPEAARDKAIRQVREMWHGDTSNCRVSAEYNADDVRVARSVAKTKAP